MKILFVCKASTTIGLGHLIRSKTLASWFKEHVSDVELDFILIGEKMFDKLFFLESFVPHIIENEKDISIQKKYDIIFFDTMNFLEEKFVELKNETKLTVSLSPIFDRLKDVDVLFNRTKYVPDTNGLPRDVYAGLEYSIIQNNCKKIGAGMFEENLNLSSFPVAISMGGGDAANKTLQLLKTLKQCTVPATFWVLLGEGYKYSYDELVREIKADTIHEIILVNTNRNMWHILRNCLLLILPGGITSYEAVFAGLPTINFLEEEDNYFLIQELIENKVCFYAGLFKEENLLSLNTQIESLYHNREELMEMHIRSKKLITESSFLKIYNILLDKLKTV
jgi:spore coat polysaccharide biosynthesis predicted glycosyltransferase SpsG